MRRLIRDRRDERGAVAVIVAALLAAGVFMGCVALSVDFGQFSANHSQLQSSADAAGSLAAQQCASTGACPTPASLDAISQQNDNTIAKSHVAAMCGSVNGTAFGTCPPSDGKITTCPAFTAPENYVQVLTQKGTHFDFTDNGAGGEATGQACSAATWGPIGTYSASLPITFSTCEWQAATGGNPLTGSPAPNYAPAPPYPPYPSASYEHKILLESKTDGACTTFNGHDAPGGFGWLTSATGCQQTATTGGWIQVDTGNSVPTGCDSQIEASLGKIVKFPVYDCMNSVASMPANPATQCSTGNGTHLYYHIAGFASFYVTGWQLAGTSQNSIATGAPACGTGEKCIVGYFVQDTGKGLIDPSAPDFGVKAIHTIG